MCNIMLSIFLQVHLYIDSDGTCHKDEPKAQLRSILKQLGWYSKALSDYRKIVPLP